MLKRKRRWLILAVRLSRSRRRSLPWACAGRARGPPRARVRASAPELPGPAPQSMSRFALQPDAACVSPRSPVQSAPATVATQQLSPGAVSVFSPADEWSRLSSVVRNQASPVLREEE